MKEKLSYSYGGGWDNMPCTLKGKYSFMIADEKVKNKAIKFLKDRGIYFKKEKDGSIAENQTIYIELMNTPIVLEKLKNTAYYDNMEEINQNIFQVEITNLSELGILIYVVHNVGDNQIFIPMSQVICFHDFDNNSFQKINKESKKSSLGLNFVKR